jgi:hypothetical protein
MVHKQAFEKFYKDNPILMKSQARKLYRHCKKAAVTILQDEAKAATGRTKVIIKRCIRIMNEKL